MDGKQLRRLKPELDLFLERYLPLFGRSENHIHAEEFVHGLLAGPERRNIENIAEAIGVKRQYSGTLGRVDNCQIGVMANYCSAKGHTLFDRRLFLPEERVADLSRNPGPS